MYKEQCMTAVELKIQNFQRPVIDVEATGKRIQFLRKSKNFSVKDLQPLFGFEFPQAIYRWEEGKYLPSIDTLFILMLVIIQCFFVVSLFYGVLKLWRKLFKKILDFYRRLCHQNSGFLPSRIHRPNYSRKMQNKEVFSFMFFCYN